MDSPPKLLLQWEGGERGAVLRRGEAGGVWDLTDPSPIFQQPLCCTLPLPLESPLAWAVPSWNSAGTAAGVGAQMCFLSCSAESAASEAPSAGTICWISLPSVSVFQVSSALSHQRQKHLEEEFDSPQEGKRRKPLNLPKKEFTWKRLFS